jgi:hypothetical protein
MKYSLTPLFAISLILGLILKSNLCFSEQLNYQPQIKISGKWLGELEIPHTAKLRMGIIVSNSTDNKLKAVLNIIDQATGDIPCDEVIYRNDSIIIRIYGLGLEIAGAVDNQSQTIKSEFRQGPGVFPVLFSHVEELPVLKRPQEPLKPYPYIEESVVFENKKAGVSLAGTLTYPVSKSTFPAVVLVTGTGQQNRDEEVGKHKPFWIIADYLTRNGIAVLRFDDRGAGGSTGNFSMSTTGDFADDALEAIKYLRSRHEINPAKIGIIGHSEGGTIAAIAASGSSDVAFIVSMAGAFENFEDVVLDQIIGQLKQQGIKEEDIELERGWRKQIYHIAGEKTDSATAAKKLWNIYDGLSQDEVSRLNWPKGRHTAQIQQVLNPWWRYILGLNNKEILRKVKCPFLAIYGELDHQVNPAKNIPVIEEALREAGNKDYTLKKLPGLNHAFQTAVTGSEYEYIRIEETVSPEVLHLMAEWISERTK